MVVESGTHGNRLQVEGDASAVFPGCRMAARSRCGDRRVGELHVVSVERYPDFTTLVLSGRANCEVPAIVSGDTLEVLPTEITFTGLEKQLQRLADLMSLSQVDARKFARCEWCDDWATHVEPRGAICAACAERIQAKYLSPLSGRELCPEGVRAMYREATRRLGLL